MKKAGALIRLWQAHAYYKRNTHATYNNDRLFDKTSINMLIEEIKSILIYAWLVVTLFGGFFYLVQNSERKMSYAKQSQIAVRY